MGLLTLPLALSRVALIVSRHNTCPPMIQDRRYGVVGDPLPGLIDGGAHGRRGGEDRCGGRGRAKAEGDSGPVDPVVEGDG
jgi:hypothetical protein